MVHLPGSGLSTLSPELDKRCQAIRVGISGQFLAARPAMVPGLQGRRMSTKPRRFEHGSAYKDGKLYLFDDRSVLVVRAWPEPRAWRLGLEGAWKGARPLGLDLAAPDTLRPRSRRRKRCQAQAFEVIPVAQRRAAARFGERAWPLHVLFTRVPGAMELAERCPALAVGLAFSRQLRPPVARPLRSARALLRDPGPRTARRVAGWLGFEPSRATVRVLSRLPARLCSPGLLRIIRDALAGSVLRKVLLHAPALERPFTGLLWTMSQPGWSLEIASPVLSAVAAAPRERAWRLVGRLQTIGELWPELWPVRPPPRLVSLRQVHRLRDRLLEDQTSPTRLRALAESLGGFPLPPVPGGPCDGFRIDPLSSVDALLYEGEHMQHCIGTRDYVSACARHRGFAYHVQPLAPSLRLHPGQQATAWITPGEAGRWALAELRALDNAEPQPVLCRAVEHWLDLQDQPGHLRRLALPEEARGRTLRVRRLRRGVAPAHRQAPPRPAPPLGQQLGLDFEIPF